MKKMFLVLVAGLLAMCMFAGCESLSNLTIEQKQKIVETGYGVGKKAVQTFVSDEDRDKFHTKQLDEAVTSGYGIYKDVKKSKEKK